MMFEMETLEDVKKLIEGDIYYKTGVVSPQFFCTRPRPHPSPAVGSGAHCHPARRRPSAMKYSVNAINTFCSGTTFSQHPNCSGNKPCVRSLDHYQSTFFQQTKTSPYTELGRLLTIHQILPTAQHSTSRLYSEIWTCKSEGLRYHLKLHP